MIMLLGVDCIGLFEEHVWVIEWIAKSDLNSVDKISGEYLIVCGTQPISRRITADMSVR